MPTSPLMGKNTVGEGLSGNRREYTSEGWEQKEEKMTNQEDEYGDEEE